MLVLSHSDMTSAVSATYVAHMLLVAATADFVFVIGICNDDVKVVTFLKVQAKEPYRLTSACSVKPYSAIPETDPFITIRPESNVREHFHAVQFHEIS